MLRVLVTGGTGRSGTPLLERLRARNLMPRILSRRPPPDRGIPAEWFRGDVLTGEGVSGSLCGVDVVVHAARSDNGEVDVRGLRHFLRLGPTAGARRLDLPSIVGAPDIPPRYYRRKTEAGEMIRGGVLPWTILRAIRFHGFVDDLLTAAATVPGILPVPRGFRIQSVATRSVAERIVSLVVEGSEPRVVQMAGPEIQTVDDMARLWLEARDERRLLLRLPVPSRVGTAFRKGRATAPGARTGGDTWSAWLARRASPSSGPVTDPGNSSP